MIQYLRIEISSFQSCNYDMTGLFQNPNLSLGKLLVRAIGLWIRGAICFRREE
jgi:hypothetical protein